MEHCLLLLSEPRGPAGEQGGCVGGKEKRIGVLEREREELLFISLFFLDAGVVASRVSGCERWGPQWEGEIGMVVDIGSMVLAIGGASDLPIASPRLVPQRWGRFYADSPFIWL